jgi:hypothetical protein
MGRSGSGDVHACTYTPTTTIRGHRVHDHANKVIGTRRGNAHRVHCVTHLAVERILDRGRQSLLVGIIGGDHPRTAGAVQADRRADCPRDRAELRYRGTRPPGHRQRQPVVGEHRPTSRMGP